MKTTKEVTPIIWKMIPEPDYYPCHLCAERKAVKHLKLSIGVVLFNFTVCDLCSQLSGTEVHDLIKTIKEEGFAKAMEQTNINVSGENGSD